MTYAALAALSTGCVLCSRSNAARLMTTGVLSAASPLQLMTIGVDA